MKRKNKVLVFTGILVAILTISIQCYGWKSHSTEHHDNGDTAYYITCDDGDLKCVYYWRSVDGKYSPCGYTSPNFDSLYEAARYTCGE